MMKSRVSFVAPTLALTGLLSALQPCHGENVSKPIVDVRFDAPYRQIQNSTCDNWTPTWAADDVLYTGCDDGSNFGGIPVNPVSFGKLEGNDPYNLLGTTVNRMREYREGVLFRSVDNSVTVDGATYKLGRCSGDATANESICLAGPTGSKPLFDNKRLKSAQFVAKDVAKDLDPSPEGYEFAAFDVGVIDGEEQYVFGRVPSPKLSGANAADWSFSDKSGSWVTNIEAAEPAVNARFKDSSGANWKSTNAYSVNGVLYMFITRLNDYERSGEPKGREIFRDASIIKSTDKGQTWTRSVDANLREPMFPGQRFGAPYFVWYGKDGAARVDDADKYVYAISNDGYFESGDTYILGRVLRSKLPQLSATDWSFFQSGDGTKDGNWTSDLTRAKPVLSDPGQSGMTGVTYIEGLGRYVMVNWHYPSHGWRNVLKNGDTCTVLEFFEAPHPWGPWKRFKTFKTEGLGWYTPIIWQRFQTTVDHSTVKGECLIFCV